MAEIEVVGYTPSELCTVSYICSDCRRHCGPNDTVCKYCGAELEPSELLKSFEPYDPYRDVPEEMREEVKRFVEEGIIPEDSCKYLNDGGVWVRPSTLEEFRSNIEMLYTRIYIFGKDKGCGYKNSEEMAYKVTKLYTEAAASILKCDASDISNGRMTTSSTPKVGTTEWYESQPDKYEVTSSGLFRDKDQPFNLHVPQDIKAI